MNETRIEGETVTSISSNETTPRTHIRSSDFEILKRYTDQPSRLPRGLRRRIEVDWGNSPIHLYALCDLDSGMKFCETWIALGRDQLAIARWATTPDRGWQVESFARSKIQEVREAPGLSCSVLTLLGEPGEPALAVLRYTHRQRRAMENIRFILEEAIGGREVAAGDPEELYVDGLARPISDLSTS